MPAVWRCWEDLDDAEQRPGCAGDVPEVRRDREGEVSYYQRLLGLDEPWEDER